MNPPAPVTNTLVCFPTVPAFDAGLTRSRAARPHRSGMVIDSPHGCLGVCGRTIHRLAGVRPIALRQSWAILLKTEHTQCSLFGRRARWSGARKTVAAWIRAEELCPTGRTASVRRTLQGRLRGQVPTTKRADFCDQQRYAA